MLLPPSTLLPDHQVSLPGAHTETVIDIDTTAWQIDQVYNSHDNLKAGGNPPSQIIIDGPQASVSALRFGSAGRASLSLEDGIVEALVLGPWGGYTLINGGTVTLNGTDAAVLFEDGTGELRLDGGTVIFAAEGDVRYLPDTQPPLGPGGPGREQNIVVSGVADFTTNGIIDFARTGTTAEPNCRPA